MSKSILVGVALLRTVISASVAGGAVKAIDLEDPEQVRKLPLVQCESLQTELSTGLFPTGNKAFRYHITKPWFGELPRSPSVDLIPAITNWNAYDRLVIDVYNASSGDERLKMFIAKPDGRVHEGLSAGVALRDHGHTRLVVWLNGKKKLPRANVGRLHVYSTEPAAIDAYLDGFYLLERGEPLPPISKDFDENVIQPYLRRQAEEKAERHETAVRRFSERCRADGQDGAVAWFGQATSMENVRPREAFDDILPAREFSLKAARGERESLQVLVLPSTSALEGVSVAVSDLRSATGEILPATAFKAFPVGYVNASNEAPYRVGYNVATNLPGGYARLTRTTTTGWWPDPILDHLGSVDVALGDLQSFWVRLTCPVDQRAGLYEGCVMICGRGWSRSFPLRVRVWDFAVPKKSPLPLAITFSPRPSVQVQGDEEQRQIRDALFKDPLSPVRQWKKHKTEWGDFLADYYITMDSLYNYEGGAQRVHWDVLKRLEAQERLGLFNIGGWGYPAKLDEESCAVWRQKTQKLIAPAYRKAKELGLLKHAYLYGCDEADPKCFPNIKYALSELRKLFPDVPLFTTAYDHNFGVGTPLAGMDWFTPQTSKYEKNYGKVAPSRTTGHQVWWYICCGPHAPFANMFIECPAIEGRMLMGAQTVRWRPDGFLYYQVSLWNSRRCISGPSAFTEWEPRSWRIYHGDGSWFCCGPDGMPCTTVRAENFRDGLEDYAYACEFQRQTGKWPDVPPEVTRDLRSFTDDPKVYYAWRDGIAEAIERTRQDQSR